MTTLLLLCLVLACFICGITPTCIIQNTGGATTDLSVVEEFQWDGPDKPGGSTSYKWMLDPCTQKQGICESSEYSAYLQQNGPGGCEKNAYFQTQLSATGGQGAAIEIGYKGNPTTGNPIMGRQGDVVINCDNEGSSYSQLTSCEVDVEPQGDNYVYTIQCKGKIACAGAPTGPPPPTPPSQPPSAPGPSEPSGPSGPGPSPSGDKGGFDGGWVFVIILLVAVVVYIVGGIVFNVVKREQRGIEAFPNIEFWKDFPWLVRDGVRFATRPCYDKIAGGK